MKISSGTQRAELAAAASSLACRQQEPGKRIQLHVGCGDIHIPGFIHIDVRSLPHVEVVARADCLTMFADDSADLIYNCHMLEHIPRGKEIAVLREWHRVLKPGGVLRTATPDFENIAGWYLEHKRLDELMGLLFGRQNYAHNVHHQIYDFARLKRLLEEAGFGQVHRYDWRETIHRDFDDFSQAYLPHMDKEHGTLMSLNVEAIKKGCGAQT